MLDYSPGYPPTVSMISTTESTANLESESKTTHTPNTNTFSMTESASPKFILKIGEPIFYAVVGGGVGLTVLLTLCLCCAICCICICRRNRVKGKPYTIIHTHNWLQLYIMYTVPVNQHRMRSSLIKFNTVTVLLIL